MVSSRRLLYGAGAFAQHHPQKSLADGAVWRILVLRFGLCGVLVILAGLPHFFAALGLLAGYHLLSPSQKPSLFKSIFCGLLIGLSLAGFVMELYPPWLVALGYLALAVFIGLALRDKLFAQLKTKRVVFGALVAVFVAGVLLAFFAKDGASGLQPLANTDYPGLRVATGGDYPFTRFLRGVYDPLTIYTDPLPRLLNNQSATASFYLFFPAILMALVIGGKRLRSKMDAVDWALVIYLTAAMFYIFVGVPEFIARISLLSYLTSVRADIGIGLASILLSVSILNKAKDEPVLTRPALTSIAILVMALFAAHGLMLRRDAENIVPIWLVALASGLMALFSVALLAGKQRVFCFGLGGIVFFTTFFFIPCIKVLGQSPIPKSQTRCAPSPPHHPQNRCGPAMARAAIFWPTPLGSAAQVA